MHIEAFNFVATARGRLAPDVTKLAILEIGSFNVNGSVRPLFAGAARYYGIDVRPGPDVDEVADAREWEGGEAFDVVVSTEVLEHVEDPERILAGAWRALKPDGILILTAAGPGRAPHGVDGGEVGSEPYANIDPEELRALLADWLDVDIHFNAAAGDTYATARKPGASESVQTGRVSGRGAKKATTQQHQGGSTQ
jgi:SAM-dependent methyltransferase